MYIVKPNRRYTILEKPDDSTPLELKNLGKAKMGGSSFSELAGCPWDETIRRYETGLNKHSREFRGKSASEVEKILEDRKDLIQYLNELVTASGTSENEFLADYLLKVTHNKIVDTSNLDNYLRLFLAMRGTVIAPEEERGNIGKYRSSMYMLRDTQQAFDAKKENSEKRAKVKKWFWGTDEEEVLEVLRYEGILKPNQVKSLPVLSDIVEKRIANIDKLNELVRTIENVSKEEIFVTNLVNAKIKEKVIRKDGKSLFLGDQKLGANVRAAVKFLRDPDNLEYLSKLTG